MLGLISTKIVGHKAYVLLEWYKDCNRKRVGYISSAAHRRALDTKNTYLNYEGIFAKSRQV